MDYADEGWTGASDAGESVWDGMMHYMPGTESDNGNHTAPANATNATNSTNATQGE